MKEHFKPVYPAETFAAADITTVFDEGQRSKSNEHSDRLAHNENSRKTEKTQETES